MTEDKTDLEGSERTYLLHLTQWCTTAGSALALTDSTKCQVLPLKVATQHANDPVYHTRQCYADCIGHKQTCRLYLAKRFSGVLLLQELLFKPCAGSGCLMLVNMATQHVNDPVYHT